MVHSIFAKLDKDEIEQFESTYEQLVEEIVKDGSVEDMPVTLKWLEKVLHYNVPHGKKVRGLMVPLTYKSIVPNPTANDMKLTYVLGWCIEMLQASFLVADDIMDGSETRRGKPCWYQVDNMGNIAFNDSFLLEHIVYRLLSIHFKDKSYYGDVVDLFLKNTYNTVMGQSLDTRTGKERNMDEYTTERYTSIVKYKTSYYTAYLPIALVMAMTGMNGPKLRAKVEQITLEIGHFFQIQDDYLDCFGDVSVTGKVGTDIQDCKCSWLFITAKEKCRSPEELSFLKENYGHNDPERIDKVKGLYVELDLAGEFERYEEESYNQITGLISEIGSELPQVVFHNLLNMIYKRKK